ncbi:ATP-binding protein [Glycomyces sp. NPDC049804]|uniref:AAA family ATPase n=1 Tax=Glycomyces sp. NPDC049804 TaxID=3154363 RepID=UPI00341261BB
MLISFKVSNYKSLRDPQELSMLPSRRDSEFEALPVAAIYGANASGKSNLIEALLFKDRFVTRWIEPLHRPFRLDQTSTGLPTSYEIECDLNGVRYEYRLSVAEGNVDREHLSAYPQNRKRVLLDRTGENIIIGATMTNRSALQTLSAETPVYAPALAMADVYKATEWQPFWKWLKTDLRRGEFTGEDTVDDLPSAVERHPILVDLAKKADLGITDLKVSDVRMTIESAGGAARSFLPTNDIERAFTQTFESEIERGAGKTGALARAFKEISRMRHVEFYHQSHAEPFSEGDESRGTISFLLYMAHILDALQDGATLVIDEFDTSLHPRIIPRIIELFQDKRTNPNNAQLIFSTHDATLLGTSFGEPILKRDEVWFVEKQEDGASELYPLTSFKPRKEHNLERHYLGGSYGGVPDIHPESLVEIVAAANKTE